MISIGMLTLCDNSVYNTWLIFLKYYIKEETKLFCKWLKKKDNSTDS